MLLHVSSAPRPKLIRSNVSIMSSTFTSNPVSSFTSRAVPSASVSPNSNVPPGMDHCPINGSLPRRISSARPSSTTTPPTPTIGRSGYSLHELIRSRFPLLLAPRFFLGTLAEQFFRNRLTLTSSFAVYNTMVGGGRDSPRFPPREYCYGGSCRDSLP